MVSHQKHAVVLLSGGLDSTTVAAVARSEGFAICALSFDYGQRHRFELQAADRVAKWVGAVRHEVVKIDLRAFGGSSLTSDLDVPKAAAHSPSSVIPSTYVPARNTIFLSFALAYAEVTGSSDIFLGINALDYSGYPDCRPEYLSAFQNVANLATKAGVEGKSRFQLHAPLLHLNKAAIVALGLKHGVDYSMTSSCYDPSPQGQPCGRCDSCHLRMKGFKEAGMRDPLIYSTEGLV
jgi:7-cyano-7-deazaguanine synthase